MTFHDPSLITALANDYGYDRWLARAIERYGKAEDAVVLLSVSGVSPSVVNAARYAKQRGMPVVAFTGRAEDNPLARLSDVNLHVRSDAYNIVEGIHSIWLTATIDFVIGKAVYEVSGLAV